MPANLNDILPRITDQIIELFPTWIELNRPAPLIEDGMGGFVKDGEDITFPGRNRYFFEAKDVTRIPMYSTTESKGQEFMETHILVGPKGDDIRTGDYFYWNDTKMTVTRVNKDKSYQTKCHVGQELRVFVP